MLPVLVTNAEGWMSVRCVIAAVLPLDPITVAKVGAWYPRHLKGGLVALTYSYQPVVGAQALLEAMARKVWDRVGVQQPPTMLLQPQQSRRKESVAQSAT